MTTVLTPAQGYVLITPNELETLRAERIRALELDHARTVLLCREVINTEEEGPMFRQLAEIERRIHVHLPPEEPEQPEPKHAAELGEDDPGPPGTSNGMITTVAPGGD